MTKKIFVAIFLCMASLSICHAQKSTFKQELAVGASFGLNFSSVSFAPKVPTKMKLGFNGGATIRWNTEPNLGIQAELNFTQHGWEEKFEEKPQYKYSRTVNYMELPFLTHIHFGSKRVRVFVNLGPKIGYALSESTESNLNVENRTGIGSFLLEGRYYYALGDMFNSRKGDTFSKSSSQIISAKLTYLIPIFSK